MKYMNKSLLVALCAMTVVSANAESFFSRWFASKEAVEVSAPSKFSSAKETCAKFVAGVATSAKDGMKTVGTSLTNTNTSVDSAITSKIGWFKNHNNTLQASKAVVATVVVAGTCYMLKKAYDAVKAYRAKKA